MLLNRIKLIYKLIVAAFILLLITDANACSCRRIDIESHVKQADVIYLGVLQSSALVEPESRKTRPYIEGIFKVKETLKGQVATTDRVTTGLGGGDCGIAMTTNRSYLIFKHAESDYVGICGASGQLGRYDAEMLDRIRSLASQ